MGFKNAIISKKGSALAMVIIILLVLSILGTAILSVASSENKFTATDSLSQSAYYVAESGIHYLRQQINKKVELVYSYLTNKEQFFGSFESDFTDKNFLLDIFEENYGELPRADIRIDLAGTGENSKDYRIQSVGSIGKTKRTVNTIITLTWSSESEGPAELLFKTLKFIFKGSNFNAPGKTIVISGQDLNSMNGGSHMNVKNIYFKDLVNGVIAGRTYGERDDPGDIYLNGNATILDSGRIMYGNVHTDGDFTVTGGVDIYGDLFVDGKFQVKGGTTIHGDLYVAEDFKIDGGAQVSGNVYVFGNVDADGGGKILKSLNVNGNARLRSVSIDGDANINGTLDADGGGEINGNANINGNTEIVNFTFGGTAKIRGNLELGWTPTFQKEVYYTGTLKTPNNFKQNILNKCQRVGDVSLPFDQNPMVAPDWRFEIPDCTASLKDDSWYTAHGYEKKGSVTSEIPPNAIWYVDNYNNTSWQDIQGRVIIVSKGDIILRGDDSFTGALIAPNGIVKYTGGDFNGVIISNKEINLSGWGTADIEDIVEFFGAANIPVNFSCSGNGSGSGGQSTSKILITTRQGIKEK